jgi:carbamoyl-phosphate synthase small subunit
MRVPAITGVDTRAITRHIRSAGAMPGLIESPFDEGSSDASAALDRLRNEAASLPSMAGRDLAHEVSCRSLYTYELDGQPGATLPRPGPHVVVVDYGAKRNILGSLARRGARVTVVPATSSADDILALRPAGILLSNGPGDPDAVSGAAETVARLLGRAPIMGICLGCQILGLAVGARTYKLKFGHRGVNQPVQREGTHRVFITSQNHGFAVDPETLPEDAEVTFTNPNDGTLEGFDLPSLQATAVQFHPEACPGPRDTAFLFDEFVARVG